ncbi:MAG: response regulator [Verrucomicrobiota bacterium]
MPLSAQAGEEIIARHRKQQTILVVENYLWIGELITHGLINLGYCSLTATDGKKAQDMILNYGARHIDLLITELDLPGLRGKELAEWFLKQNPQGKVLVMTAYTYGAELCKIAAFLRKPFSHESFVRKIGELLGPARSNSFRPSNPGRDEAIAKN